MPSGFDQLAAPSNTPAVIAADGTSRIFVGDATVVNAMDDGAATWTNVSPSTNSIFITAPVSGLSPSADGGTLWAAAGAQLMVRGTGAAAVWERSDAGLPSTGTVNTPGFDSAGNGYLAVNSATAQTAQLYKLTGGVWAAYGPVAPTRFTGAPVVTADGTLFVSATLNDLYRLDAAATTYTPLNLLNGKLAHGKDDAVYVLVGSGAQLTVHAKAAGATTFSVSKALGGANGSSDQGGICVHPSGDVYAVGSPVSATVSGVWRRDFTTGVWSELALTPVPTGRVLAAACAPNGRVYTIRGTPITNPRVFRSKP